MSRKKTTSKVNLLGQYRAAVCDLMVSLFEHDLTSAHLDRTGRLTGDGASTLQAVQRELEKRLARFTVVESQRWLKQTALLEVTYKQRDERNKNDEKRMRARSLPVRIPA